MFFVTRLQRSWRLFWACWALFRSQPEMMIYPFISGAASLGFLALLLGPFVLDRRILELFAEDGTFKWQAGVIMFLLGFGMSVIANFCSTALAASSLSKLAGKEISVEDAFAIAAARFGPIVAYSVLAATIGMILQAIQERGGIIGQIVGSLLGVAWTMSSFLVIPVLVMEDVGPIDALGRSSKLLKKTWGEQIAGTFGIGMATGVIIALVIMIGAIFFLAAGMIGLWPLQVFFAVLTAVTFVGVLLISRTMSGIYTVAVYAYATHGRLMPGLDNDLIAGAFAPKRKSGFFG